MARSLSVALSAVALVAGVVPVTGGSSQQRAVVRELIGRLGPTHLVSARIIEHNPNGNGAAITLRFRKPLTKFDAWQGYLLAEAFVEQSIDHHLRPVGWYWEGDGSGSALGYQDSRPPRPPAMSARTIAQLPAFVRRTVAARGAAVDQVRILRLYRAAIVVSIRTRHPARFLRTQTGPLLGDLGFLRNTFDGVFLSVEDARGHVVYQAATTNIGGVGTEDQNGPFGKYKSCFSIGLDEPTEAPTPKPKPPPCPG